MDEWRGKPGYRFLGYLLRAPIAVTYFLHQPEKGISVNRLNPENLNVSDCLLLLPTAPV